MKGPLAVIGMECFSLSLRRTDGALSLDGVAEDGSGFASFWEPARLPIEPSAAIAALASSWPEIAGPFHPAGTDRGAFDLSSLVGRRGEAVLEREGTEAVLKTGGKSIELGRHSVVAVEVLLKLGNLLAKEAGAEHARRWREASEGTDLFPFPALSNELEPEPGSSGDELAWHAARLGCDPLAFRLAAIWLHARQVLFGVFGEGCDVPHGDWSPASLPPGLPGEEEVMAMAQRAAAALGKDVAEVVETAVVSRNADARQLTVYRRWYPIERTTLQA